MEVSIRASELPGRRCDDGMNPAYENVQVGVQRSRDVEGAVPGDAESASWDIVVDVVDRDGVVDFRGPYVHGKRGERFLYLTWGSVDGSGAFAMFRRAKLMLSDVGETTIRDAAAPGRRLVGRLGLTARNGLPVCARVKSDAIEWRAE